MKQTLAALVVVFGLGWLILHAAQNYHGASDGSFSALGPSSQ